MFLPFVVPPSVKIAIGVGTITGATLALITNREKVRETAEQLLERGSQFCKMKLEEYKQAHYHMANNVEDAFYSDYAPQEKSVGRTSGMRRRNSEDNTTPEYTDDEDEAVTPDASDFEYDDEKDGSDIDTHSLD